MGRVFSDYGPHPWLAVAEGSRCSTTRVVSPWTEPGEPHIELTAGTRLRHVETRYSAECIPPIEYADIYFEVETGVHAGKVVWFQAYDLNQSVEEITVLRDEFGLECIDGAGKPIEPPTGVRDADRWPSLPLPPSILISSAGGSRARE